MSELLSPLRAAALLLALAAIFFAGRYYRSSKYPQIDAGALSLALEREAAEINATLPEMVSEHVRLDRAATGPGNAFTYIYTIVDNEAAKAVAADAAKFSELRAQLRTRVCTMMPEFRERGTIVSYSLKDSAGAPIAEISVHPDDCS